MSEFNNKIKYVFSTVDPNQLDNLRSTLAATRNRRGKNLNLFKIDQLKFVSN